MNLARSSSLFAEVFFLRALNTRTPMADMQFEGNNENGAIACVVYSTKHVNVPLFFVFRFMASYTMYRKKYV